MAVGAFPIAKLGVLGIKHISKPISNLIKRLAKSNQFFKKYICTPPAQIYNWLEVRSKIFMLKMGQPKRVPPLSEAMAVQMGGDILGELIIFIAGVGLIMFEFTRQARKDKRKHEKHRTQRAELSEKLTVLTDQVYRQSNEIKALQVKVNEIQYNIL